MSKKLKAVLYLSTFTFLFYTIWWVFLRLSYEPFGLTADNFTDSYGALAAIGGLGGVFVAREWGGFKSYMGKAISAFSLGLLAQAIGQLVYSYYYFILNVEVPYPSWGDAAYFGSVLLYIYGAYNLTKVSGAKISLKLYANKIQAFLIPLAILTVSYVIFLRGYEFDFTQPLTVFLDFGYPMGQAIYLSITILTFMLSRKILGGVMRWPILFILIALAAQYLGDYVYLFQVQREVWEPGAVSDFIFLTAYILMSFALISASPQRVLEDERK